MKEIYTVRNGDTIENIATKFEMPQSQILSDNKISESNIKQGLLLVINKIDGTRYIVKPFDTIDKIASKYNTTVDRIKQHNNITQVFLGEIIYLPLD